MFLFVGGLIFLVYFWSIGFMPEMDAKALVTLLAASVLTAGFLLIALIYCLFAPFMLWKSLMPNYERLQTLWYKDEQYAPARAMLWVGLPFVTIVGGIVSFGSSEWMGISKWWGLALCALSVITPPLVVLLFWKKLSNNLPCILRWRVTRDLLLGLFLSFLGLFISILTLSAFIGRAHLSVTYIVLLSLAVLIWNFAMIMNMGQMPLWKHLFIALMILYFIFLISNQLTLIPNHVINIYKFGNLPDTSLVFDEMGGAIVQHRGVKVTPSTPDSTTTATPSPKICFLSKVTIHSRLGSTYYLEASRNDNTSVRFTIPAQNVLSWAVNEPKPVTTAGSPTSTQNPASTTETTPPSKGIESTR